MSDLRSRLSQPWLLTHVVFASFDHGHEVEAAQSDLRQGGLDESSVLVLPPGEIGDYLDSLGKHEQNPAVRMLRFVWGLITPEGGTLQEYEQEGKEGNYFAAVHVGSEEQVAWVNEVLRGHGGHNVKYFSRGNISDVPEPE